MKPQCIAAVSRAAGRQITQAEAQGIEERVRAAMRTLAARDLEAFRAQSVDGRLQAAAELAAQQLKDEAANARRFDQMKVRAHERLQGFMARARELGLDPQDALDRLLLDNADGRAPVLSLETRIKATQEDYKRRLTDTIEAVEPRLFGMLADEHGQQLLTRELFGESTGEPIMAKAAEAWRKTVDAMVGHFRDAGGVLNRLEDWRFPQHHDQVKVFAAGRDAWIEQIMPALDRRRYTSENGRLMDDGELRTFLEHAWDTIATGGANKIEPGQAGGAAAIANRELEHRVLHFKDAEGYLAYQARFGGRDLWSTMGGHVDRLSREIALMETLGPSADREFAYWNDWATREARHAKQNAQAVARRLDNAYRQLAGYTEGVSNTTVARVFDDTRNVLTAARLGSAVISSIPDLATLTLTAAYNHVSILGTWGRALQAINPLAHEGRAELERAGLMVNSTLQAIRRYQVDSLGASYTARMANAVLTASGLNHWTDSLRAGYAATQAHALGGLSREHERLADVPPADRQLLEAKGVTDIDFQIWHRAELDATRFGKLLTPDAIYRLTDAQLGDLVDLPVTDVARSPLELKREAATKLLGVTISESHMAVVEPGARERLQMAIASPKGDIKGELLKSFWQFKTFPWAFFQKHMVQRGMGQETAGGKIAYLGPLVIMSTLLGAAAMQINDLLTGKDPRPLFGADAKVLTKNWIAAALKGGALGMYGDFLGADATQDAKSALAALLGPIAGMVSDAGQMVLGNAVKAGSDQQTKAGADAVKFVKGVTPGANLWYSKAAFDHWLYNWLQDQLNPGYTARMESRSRREYGQSSWWSPGSASPSRAPDLGSIVGK